MQFNIPLKHHVKQFTPVFLRWHLVLLRLWNRIYKVTIITNDYILILKEHLSYRFFKSNQYIISRAISPCQPTQLDTNHMNIAKSLNNLL